MNFRRPSFRRTRTLRYDAAVVVDLETTGFSPQNDRITEIGAVKIVDGAPDVYFEALVEPDPTGRVFVLPQVTQKTGITEALLREKGVPLRDALIGLETFANCGGDNVLYVGHNFENFDGVFLGNARIQVGLPTTRLSIRSRNAWDTLYGERYLLREGNRPGNPFNDLDNAYMNRNVQGLPASLDVVVGRYGISAPKGIGRGRHSALTDAALARLIFKLQRTKWKTFEFRPPR